MHPEWITSKQSFIEYVQVTLGERPTGCSLDRIDNNRGYFPGNIRWADRITQASNRTNNKIVMYEGVKMTQSECARRIGISRERVRQLSKKENNRYGIVFLEQST